MAFVLRVQTSQGVPLLTNEYGELLSILGWHNIPSVPGPHGSRLALGHDVC